MESAALFLNILVGGGLIIGLVAMLSWLVYAKCTLAGRLNIAYDILVCRKYRFFYDEEDCDGKRSSVYYDMCNLIEEYAQLCKKLSQKPSEQLVVLTEVTAKASEHFASLDNPSEKKHLTLQIHDCSSQYCTRNGDAPTKSQARSKDSSIRG